ncbi:MAG: MFS transporter [Promethearchaeota archaeon]
MSEQTFSWKQIFVIGLGFLTTGLSWQLFNDFVPLILQEYSIFQYFGSGFVAVIFVAGLIMGVDNLIALIMNPLMGSRSDKTKTRYGRRMPYVMVGIPMAAGFFIGLPLTLLLTGPLALISIVILILGFDISMAIYRAPVVAMMPDFTPAEKRSPANGVINLMGGVGAIISFTLGAYLYDLSPTWAFFVSALIMLLCLGILFLAIREPEIPKEVEKVEGMTLWQSLREALGDRSIICVLMAIFFWFIAYNTVDTWFTSYGTFTLGWTAGQSSQTKLPFALAIILFAIPAGFIARKIGRKRSIIIGLIGMIAMIVIVPFTGGNRTLILAILGVAGAFWAMVNVNSIVILWELSRKKLGAQTGIYYVFSQTSAAIAPSLFGAIVFIPVIPVLFPSTTIWVAIWPFSVIFLLAALLCMLGVQRGEAGEEETLT